MVALAACGGAPAADAPTAQLGVAPGRADTGASGDEGPSAEDPVAEDPPPADQPEGEAGREASAEGGEVREAPREMVEAGEAARDPGGPAGAPPPPPPPPDPAEFAVPEEIDVAYAQRVIDALYRVVGDAARAAATSGTLDQGFFGPMTAVYDREELSGTVLPGWIDQADADFPDLADEPGDPVTTVLAIERDDLGCLVLEAERDYNALYREPGELERVRLVLRPVPEGTPADANPTPWIIARAGAQPEEDPCA